MNNFGYSNSCLSLGFNGSHPGQNWLGLLRRRRRELLRFVGYESIAEDLEQPRLALPASAAESIDRRAYIDIDETASSKRLDPRFSFNHFRD
jgi:hypothetical protein